MRNAVLVRSPSTDEGTPGRLLTDSGWICCTLELPWRDNKTSISCIKKGIYKVAVYISPRFGKTYRLEDKNGRTYILMHSANFAGDKNKGFQTHVEGCIALGKYFGRLQNKFLRKQLAVLASRPTVRSFFKEMAGEPFLLTVIGGYDD